VPTDALDGKILVQLVDETHAVRVDVFRAFGEPGYSDIANVPVTA
jgi:hypothetical protein